jgi:hypothetical protein
MKTKAILADSPNSAVESINSFLTREDVIPYSLSLTEIGSDYLLTMRYESAYNFRKGSVRLSHVMDLPVVKLELEKRLKSIFKPKRGMEMVCHDLFSSGASLFAVVLELQLP